jgi:citrate lyase subunit beta / citryl-CoA lyase
MTSRPAVTWLFVPGDRPDRFDKALNSGAEETICDLEDGVAPERKSAARDAIAGWLGDQRSAWVRINGVATQWHAEDVAALAGQAGLRGVLLPKAESAEALLRLRAELGPTVDLIALIETAVGIHRAIDIAGCDAVDRLAFGSLDYALDINADGSDDSLLLARSTLVIASRVAGKPAPIDGATTTLDDPTLLRHEAGRAAGLGFGGKLCVHPSQLAPVAEAFRPSEDDIAWARRVVEATSSGGSGASALDGVMIDEPVMERARRILDRA